MVAEFKHLPQKVAFLPRILVLLAEDGERRAVEHLLAGQAEVESVSGLAELEERLRAEPFEIVVTRWQDGIFERVANARPGVRLIHLGTDLPDGLVEAAAAGAPVGVSPAPQWLPEQVADLTRSKRAAHRRLPVHGLQATWAGSEHACTVVDLSTHGLAFQLGDDAAPPLPGWTLRNLVVRRGAAPVIDGVDALVRYVAPVAGGYRVGCVLLPPRSAPAESRQTVRDLAQRVGFLSEGIKSGLYLERADDHARARPVAAHGASVSSDGITVDGVELQLGRHDVVRGRFDRGGSVYTFLAAVVDVAPLRLALPATLTCTGGRATLRVRPLERAISVAITLPFTDVTVTRPVVNLSAAGLAFEIDAAADLFPVGARLRLVIDGGDLRLSCAARVKHVDAEAARCGLAFADLDEATRAQLDHLVVTTRFPRLEDGSATDFDHVLDLFRASGFLPEAKERMLTPALPEVRRMVGALQAPLGLFKSLVVRNDDRVEGHLSSLRVYRRTWMPQHLASRAKAVHATSALNVGTLAYLAQQPDLEYLRVWFLRESTWPARVFGGFARKLHDPTRSDLRSYCHFHVATSHELPGVRGCVRVSAAGAPELALVERHFLERERGLIPDAEDLGRAHLELRDLDEAFARAGVQRRREILVAFERDRPLGFVLAELSSPGLNLYEALSSFRLYLLPAASRQRQEVRLALLDATLALYRRHGRAYARGLLPPDEARDYEALGLTLDPVTSMCWTAHRTLLQPFAEHIHRLLNRQGVAR